MQKCQPRGSVTWTLISMMASSGVVKVILSFYRDDDKGSAFERRRGHMPFDLAKHNSIDIVCKHLTDFKGIKQAQKFGLGAFDLKLF